MVYYQRTYKNATKPFNEIAVYLLAVANLLDKGNPSVEAIGTRTSLWDLHMDHAISFSDYPRFQFPPLLFLDLSHAPGSAGEVSLESDPDTRQSLTTLF